MDDKRLQSEFDGYFEGADLPKNLTADAKAQVKPRKREIRKWFLRLAPVAAAFVLIVAISIAYATRPSPPSDPDNFGADNVNTPEPQYSYYTAEGLTEQYIDPYSAKDFKGLEFAQNLAYMANSDIYLTAFYDNDTMVMAQAEISLLHNGYRHDAVVFAEYTDKYHCFEELKNYHTGEMRYYRGYDYVYTKTYADGEPVYMIYMYKDGVKYYLNVTTTEPNGYQIFLDFLKNN